MGVTELHDAETLELDDLEGYDIRLNKPGGRHVEILGFDQGMVLKHEVDPPLEPGDYELAFREPGTTAWHNDAKLPVVTIA